MRRDYIYVDSNSQEAIKAANEQLNSAKSNTALEVKKATEAGGRVKDLEEEEKELLLKTEKAYKEQAEAIVGINKLKKYETKLEESVHLKNNEIDEKNNEINIANKKLSEINVNSEVAIEQSKNKAEDIISAAEKKAKLIIDDAEKKAGEIDTENQKKTEEAQAKLEADETTSRSVVENRKIEEKKLVEIESQIKSFEALLVAQKNIEKDIVIAKKNKDEILELGKSARKERKAEETCRDEVKIERMAEESKLEKAQGKMLGLLSRERKMNESIPMVNKILEKVYKTQI